VGRNDYDALDQHHNLWLTFQSKPGHKDLRRLGEKLLIPLKITNVSTIQRVGVVKYAGGKFWEDRLQRPVDIYSKFKNEGPDMYSQEKGSPGELRANQTFVVVETDEEGVSGIAGPIGAPAGEVETSFINAVLKPALIGENPLAVERVWDIMYRFAVHGRKGDSMMAISAVDCAIWDLVGKYYRRPVFELLGGTTRDSVPAYASMLGFSLNPEDVAKRSAEFAEKGFIAMKWFMKYGPSDGIKGEELNVEVVKAVRDAVGYDVKLMLDCWMSWGVNYTVRMARKLQRYEIEWIEEPVMPDDVEGYVEIRRQAGIPISGGEHEYTRWGFKQLFEKKAVDVAQPDIMWAGGISETVKICALASSYGIPVVPHTGVMTTTLNLLFSKPPALCPIAEYLVKWNAVNQVLFKTKLVPSGGNFIAPQVAGLGIELNSQDLM